MKDGHIAYYDDFLSPRLKKELLSSATPLHDIKGLKGHGNSGGLETQPALKFLCELLDIIRPELDKVLRQRILDRKFIDERTTACHEYNKRFNIPFDSPAYKTVLGMKDGHDRIVMGPLSKTYTSAEGQKPVAPIPSWLKGHHVTLFGPPGDEKMCINAMNAWHRKIKDEPAIIGELLSRETAPPKWGADDEDSKTPLRQDLIDAGKNLLDCYNNDLKYTDPKTKKNYELAADKLSLPLKRFPGLALPSFFLFYNDEPVPLHLYDFALHLYHNQNRPEALVFYVPKLENEEEARYIRIMIEEAEKLLQKTNTSYRSGTVRLMIVLENPRAVFRTNEIMDELHPYFAGASLGWHDYLGSTARLFKNDPGYRIPVKADPDIVIKYIKASHELLSKVVGPRGGIKVGGMYGILPTDNDLNGDSFQVTIKGYFKDVITQMKRNLDGFWVAHPDFVRIGIAMVKAWHVFMDGDKKPLEKLITGLLNKKHQEEIWKFIEADDIPSLDSSDPGYARALLVADIGESNIIANNHPDEVRYNIFQMLQYLTDWLAGNGCVALPSQVGGSPVRVMDDLATAERSRWEVWHEIHHGRFSPEDFIRMAHEEMNFIRRDLSDSKKIVQVKWGEHNKKWYPVAFKLMLKLMTDDCPVEFATQLLLPFTIPALREAEDPWTEVLKLDEEKFSIKSCISRLDYYFECCGCGRFAKEMASNLVFDIKKVEQSILSFTTDEIIEAASFHGDIGQKKKSLDAHAAAEQAGVDESDDATNNKLLDKGKEYLERHGFKFLVSAKGKSAREMMGILESRINNDGPTELDNARKALFEITRKRMEEMPLDGLMDMISGLKKQFSISDFSGTISADGQLQTIHLGDASKPDSLFEMASLSKTVASAFALEYFSRRDVKLQTKVNDLFALTGSDFRLTGTWGDEVELWHLMSHCALNMHYVNGFPLGGRMPPVSELIEGQHGYEPVDVINTPGKTFKYSGGGYLVLEHLIESLEGKRIQELTTPFLQGLGLEEFTFEQTDLTGKSYVRGLHEDGNQVEGGRKMFPAFAAGAMSTSRDMSRFLLHLENAWHDLEGSGPISHDTAVRMLHGTDKGCRIFMGATMGIGTFIVEAGDNRFALHQGANDGFRAIYLHCFDGPDRGKGLSLFCNGGTNAVLFLSRVTQEILKHFRISGIDYDKFVESFDPADIPQEQIVNIGYKELIFNAFRPTRPEEIIEKGPLDPLSKDNRAIGARILSVSNERFARVDNLFSPNEPVFDPELFGRQGKIMDSWESARHNPEPCEEVVFELKDKSKISHVAFSTKYHLGNQVCFARVMGQDKGKWKALTGKAPLSGHAMKIEETLNPEAEWKILKVETWPDGGLSRLGLFYDADKLPREGVFMDEIPKPQKPLALPWPANAEIIEANYQALRPGEEYDVASRAFGGHVINVTNEHYGPADQLISPWPPIHMFDGFESARSREENHRETITIRLGKKAAIHSIVFDFTWFINNNPMFVEVEGLVEKTNVKAFAGNKKEFILKTPMERDELTVHVYPDGGINRIHVYARN